MQVRYEYLDFDGEVKEAEATVHQDGEWFWAENLATFGCGKKVSSEIYWKPIRGALLMLMSHRGIVSYEILNP